MILREQSKVHNKSLEYNVKPQQVTREEIDYNVSNRLASATPAARTLLLIRSLIVYISDGARNSKPESTKT